MRGGNLGQVVDIGAAKQISAPEDDLIAGIPGAIAYVFDFPCFGELCTGSENRAIWNGLADQAGFAAFRAG